MDRRKHISDCVEIIARAIILDEMEAKILLCSPRDKCYYYLPGGHVDFSETSKMALKREIGEETGIKIKESELIFSGVAENIFFQKNQKKHEINLYFRIEKSVSSATEVLSREEHIVFSWIPLSELSKFPIFPETVKKTCEEFAKNKNTSWSTM